MFAVIFLLIACACAHSGFQDLEGVDLDIGWSLILPWIAFTLSFFVPLAAVGIIIVGKKGADAAGGENSGPPANEQKSASQPPSPPPVEQTQKEENDL